MNTKHVNIPDEQFKKLGNGQFAYMRQLNTAQISDLLPPEGLPPEGLPPALTEEKLWVLFNPDGTPIMLAESQAAVEAEAVEQNLHVVSVH